jgi:hypothetical protein
LLLLLLCLLLLILRLLLPPMLLLLLRLLLLLLLLLLHLLPCLFVRLLLLHLLLLNGCMVLRCAGLVPDHVMLLLQSDGWPPGLWFLMWGPRQTWQQLQIFLCRRMPYA